MNTACLGGLGFAALVFLAYGWMESAPAFPGATQTEIAKANNAFALDLYARLSNRPGNLFFSPASISTALAMTYAGARGETAQEMAATLHFTIEAQRLHPAFGALLRDLNNQGKKNRYRLSVANALWAQQGHSFLPEFVELTKTDYGAGVHDVDFVGAAEAARQTINTWVEKQTEDKIKDLMPRGIVSPDTRLVLTNAIYFKGNWQAQFNKEQTHESPFQVAADQKVNAPFMNQTGKFKYLDGDTFQALELPYAGKDLAMIALLPKQPDGLTDFEKQLSAAKLVDWLHKMRETEVIVSLPKFKLTSEFGLKETLTAMGMQLAFSSSADFSGMDGKRDLFLSAVIHKAFVDVNEEGTEAAAATGVGIRTLAVRVKPMFRADHPFLFLIQDRRSGSILFLGRLANP